MSPQIVTETIWTLIQERDFVPTEIRLITTRNGRNRTVRDLLDPVDGRFHSFCREYDLVGKIHFDESCITVIGDEEGHPLDDIRTPEENGLAADTIVKVIGSLCSDPRCAIHVSIAGGRKSMGFFAGYAMSLFARDQDSVSHVLVNEPFESNPDFYYPPVSPKDIVSADGHVLHAQDARVMLADIPIVRLRTGLPDDLLHGTSTYRHAVAEAQQSLFPDRRMIFNADSREVTCDGKAVRLTPAPFAILYWMARRCADGLSAIRPGHAEAEEFFALYEELFPSRLGDLERAKKATCSDEDFLKYFQEKRSHIASALEKNLGKRAAVRYGIRSRGRRPFVSYELALDPQEIIF